MNSASQLLRALAIVGALAAGALFYLSNNKTKAVADRQSTTASNPASDEALKEANDKLAAAVADKDKLAADLDKAKQDAALADQARGDAIKDNDAALKKARDAQNALDDKDTQIADLTKKVSAADDLSSQIKDLKDQNAKLQTQVDTLITTQPTNSGATAATPGKNGKPEVVLTPIQLAPPAPAKILQIDTKQWLLVLDVGGDANVKTDTQLQLKVGNEDVGTVVVRDNAAGMATAAIVNTGGMSEKDYARIVTRGLNLEFQRVIQ